MKKKRLKPLFQYLPGVSWKKWKKSFDRHELIMHGQMSHTQEFTRSTHFLKSHSAFEWAILLSSNVLELDVLRRVHGYGDGIVILFCAFEHIVAVAFLYAALRRKPLISQPENKNSNSGTHTEQSPKPAFNKAGRDVVDKFPPGRDLKHGRNKSDGALSPRKMEKIKASLVAKNKSASMPVHVDAAELCIPLVWPIGLFLPFFGIWGLSVLAVFLPDERPSESAMYQEYLEFVQRRNDPHTRFESIDVEHATLERLNIEPVVDILSGTDKTLVWGSIEVLSELADEEAVGLIKKTMDDHDMDIKFYSSWGLDRIEKRFLREIDQRREELKCGSGRNNVLAFVEVMNRYLRSGLLDLPMARAFAQEALEWLFQMVRQDFENPDLKGLIAVTNQLAGNYGVSLMIFSELWDKKILPHRFFPECAEAFFFAGDLERTEEVMEEGTRERVNQAFLAGRSTETSLSSLREFWLAKRDISVENARDSQEVGNESDFSRRGSSSPADTSVRGVS
ncbi:MAG: hypothetical protein HQM09_02645 [Candidatus Riflebacteria bacterium]|nr:hypothetical protein [Candidatus Riflebacteria bacterium]